MPAGGHTVTLETAGLDWIIDEIKGLTDTITKLGPVEFCEANRYLPASVTPIPGFMSYDVNPYMREIVDCFDVDSPIREVNLMKGVQLTYTAAVLESVLFYFMAYLKVYPTMFVSADKELVKERIENNILPMLQQSGFDIIRSSDEGNTRKTGKTASHLQWEGGGFLIPAGALNAAKMRSHSVLLMLKDEIDGWPDTVGKDGCPDALTDSRTDAYSPRRKILRGSTPLLLGSSKIFKAYKMGDQRKYQVCCKHCGFPQELRWGRTRDGRKTEGIVWEFDDGVLIPESVRYLCQDCGGEHFNHDKEILFPADKGAHWKPTARSTSPEIRSYHLSALYSPLGMKSWGDCARQYLQAFDPITGKVVDVAKYQIVYNNIFGWPFEVLGDKVRFAHVSSHRRTVYRLGEIPNKYAAEHSGSPILFLTCKVDVHVKNLAVSVMGWCRDSRPYVIDYWRFEDEDCTRPESPAWASVRSLIEESEYQADDGRRYRIFATFIDAGFANATVVDFCSDYAAWVFPILGRQRPAKNQTIKEFGEFTTSVGTTGYRITVDHYKDRIAPVLRRGWTESEGPQKRYHFNAPVDITDKQLKELTVETRREKTDANGHKSYEWHRPSGVANELWDLLVYGHAGVEIIAHIICMQHFGLETVEWPKFWDYMASILEEPPAA